MHALTGRAKASLVCKVFLESIAKTLKEHPKAPTPKKKVSAQFDISSRMVLHKPNQKPSLSYQQDFAYLSGRNARGRPFPWCSMSDCCSFVSWKYGQRLVEYGKEIHPQDLPYVWPNYWAETPSPTPKKNNRFQYAVPSHINSCTAHWLILEGSQARSFAFRNGKERAKKTQIQ